MSGRRFLGKNKAGTNLNRDCCSRGRANVIAKKETTQCREQEPRFQMVTHQYRKAALSICFLITPIL